MVNAFHTTVSWLMYILCPHFWRVLFTGRIRVAVYLKSGQVVKFNCTTYTVTYGEKWAAEGLTSSISFRPNQIVAFREIRWF